MAEWERTFAVCWSGVYQMNFENVNVVSGCLQVESSSSFSGRWLLGKMRQRESQQFICAHRRAAGHPPIGTGEPADDPETGLTHPLDRNEGERSVIGAGATRIPR